MTAVTRSSRPRTVRGPRTRHLATAIVLAVGLAACGGGDDGGPAATTTAVEDATADGTAAADGTSDGEGVPVTTAATDLGTILVTADGATLYGFTNDERGVSSACSGDCLAAWPPVLVDGVPAGLDPAVFDVITREDGTVQLTAGGWPLYTYAADQAAGDTTGQAVGDVWWVVAPDGELITTGG